MLVNQHKVLIKYQGLTHIKQAERGCHLALFALPTPNYLDYGFYYTPTELSMFIKFDKNDMFICHFRPN
jgi:hypothetical protein